MKVLVLNGSPKAKSDTMVFTSAFLKGLNCQNEHEIKIVNLIEKKIGRVQAALNVLSQEKEPVLLMMTRINF